MTEFLTRLLLRVTAAGAVSAIAIQVARQGALAEVTRMAAGLLMLLALLQPLVGLQLPNPLSWLRESSARIAQTQTENEQTTVNAFGHAIATAIETQAAAEGFTCTAAVSVKTDADGVLQIDRVTVEYPKAQVAREQTLRALLTEVCGVPPEQQEVIAR